jgi:hypothetical protein
MSQVTIKELKSLTKDEKKIYDSVIRNFPATSPDSAYNIAIQGGVSFQFIQK